MINAVVIDICNQSCRLGEIVVTQQDSNTISPDGIHCWIATARLRIIDNIIMNKRRQMDHFKGDA